MPTPVHPQAHKAGGDGVTERRHRSRRVNVAAFWVEPRRLPPSELRSPLEMPKAKWRLTARVVIGDEVRRRGRRRSQCLKAHKVLLCSITWRLQYTNTFVYPRQDELAQHPGSAPLLPPMLPPLMLPPPMLPPPVLPPPVLLPPCLPARNSSNSLWLLQATGRRGPKRRAKERRHRLRG